MRRLILAYRLNRHFNYPIGRAWRVAGEHINTNWR
jgi:hypothetical protein